MRLNEFAIVSMACRRTSRDSQDMRETYTLERQQTERGVAHKCSGTDAVVDENQSLPGPYFVSLSCTGLCVSRLT